MIQYVYCANKARQKSNTLTTEGIDGMKHILMLAAVSAATVAFGGFWDAVNKVKRTVDTVNAVGDLINGSSSTTEKSSSPAPASAPTTSAAPATSAAAAPAAPAVDPALVASFAQQRTASTDTAVPEVKYGSVYFKKPATPEQIQEAKTAYLADKREIRNTRLNFEGVDDATLAAGLAAFAGASYVSVKESNLTTLAPFAIVRSATQVQLYKVQCTDLKPLASCAAVRTLEIKYCSITDMSGLAAMPALESIDLYGSTVAGSFAPLASCPRLRKIDFYAVKAPQETYDSLGALRQVTSFYGGLTKMTSLKWVASVPQATELKVFAEKIDDMSPVSKLANLTYFRGWNMDGRSMATALGDLSFLANCRKLKKLELPGSAYSNTAVIGTFADLEELDLSTAKQPVDVSFVKSLPKLKRIALRGTEVVNGSAIPASVKVYSDDKTKGL